MVLAVDVAARDGRGRLAGQASGFTAGLERAGHEDYGGPTGLV
jgi:hypothetical protein